MYRGNISIEDDVTIHDVVKLLSVANGSSAYEELIAYSWEQSKMTFGDKGYIFAQIGLNSAACTGNCKFCSLACDTYEMNPKETSEEEILALVKKTVEEQVDAVFLMTTADYPLCRYLDIVAKASLLIPKEIKIIANVGDFTLEEAHALKAAGITGVYHIVRLREGIDTDISVELREQTIAAIKDADLELLYCIEPIGPEHSYEEIAVEILRAKRHHVDVMACMKRVAVPGTPLFELGEIGDEELTKIVAVSNIVVKPKTSMNIHEPNKNAMRAGVNQLYAEIGINPRDVVDHTELSRGYHIEEAKGLLREFGYNCNN